MDIGGCVVRDGRVLSRLSFEKDKEMSCKGFIS